MNNEEIYRTTVEKVFDDQCQSLEKTITYLSNHKMTAAFRQARRNLDDRTKNDILRDVSYPF
ncbi:hypothetical protein M5C72_06200 [Companilactobacillus allii]|uniref:Uncharacterized protein n=1 Tax=Companilactobacillus allii TaxID=1847728 RepID=A0A1P8Q4J5_9LACO|nr:hypothetical protein [Companilactobacillus allii]APX72699.1 hypothetical protein BTM29_09115 [Companilactobacillus allii]USQ69805.1 hypothetical protein M5C72_06200 [Companilactobacillus allii]